MFLHSLLQISPKLHKVHCCSLLLLSCSFFLLPLSKHPRHLSTEHNFQNVIIYICIYHNLYPLKGGETQHKQEHLLIINSRLVVLRLHGIYWHITLFRPQPLGISHDCGRKLRCLHHDWSIHRLLPA